MIEVRPVKDNPQPLLYCFPHSGRDYPADFQSALPHHLLQRAEDAYVDLLLDNPAQQGISTLRATFPRSYVDVNRDVADLDPLLIDSDEPIVAGPKSALGIGLLRRIVTPGENIYDRRLNWREVEHRLEHCYHPYHRALAEQLHTLKAQCINVAFIDWHSMKSRGNAATPDGDGAVRADFVIGNLHGQSAKSAITASVKEYLQQQGYSVAINTPYAGATILSQHTCPSAGIHGLQIEINRALYMDEAHWQLLPQTEPLKAVLSGIQTAVLEGLKA